MGLLSGCALGLAMVDRLASSDFIQMNKVGQAVKWTL